MQCNRPETTARCFSTFRSHRAIVVQVNDRRFTQANQSNVTDVPVVPLENPTCKPVFTVTGERAHTDFQTRTYPWRICLGQGPLSIFCSTGPVMSSQRCEWPIPAEQCETLLSNNLYVRVG